MSPIRIRRALRRRRHSLAALTVMLTLGAAVAIHHGAPANMDAMPGHAVCLAVLAIGGVALIAVGRRQRRPLRPRLALAALPWPPSIPRTARSIPARAGPSVLEVLRL